MPMMPRACKNGKKNYGAGEDSDNDNRGSNCKDEESDGEWESAGEHGTKAPQPSKRQSQKSTPNKKNICAGRGTIAKKSQTKKKKTGGRSTAQRREVIADSENLGCAYHPTKFCGVLMHEYASGKTTFSARVWNKHEGKSVNLGAHDTDVTAAEVVDAYRRVLAKRHSDEGYLKNINFENGNFVYRAKNHGYRGIYWEASRKKWKTSIKIGKVFKYIGRYVNPTDAAKAFDAEAVIHGRTLNFPKL
jgi:hypothetical protein